MKKILIIEDEPSIAELERDYLEAYGLSVTIADSGEKGLQEALKDEYDLVILDLMLPQIDGFEVCRQIRKKFDIPIIIVSAKKEEIDMIRGLGLGADDYINKPFSPGELVARVKAHLARFERLVKEPEDEKDTIDRGGLHIDKNSRRVYVNNKEVIFTTKEFDLLTLLASNPNRVFTKEDLFERIWGMDSMGDLSTVTVHIRRIRTKIEKQPDNPQYIDTIWGVGYRFKA